MSTASKKEVGGNKLLLARVKSEMGGSRGSLQKTWWFQGSPNTRVYWRLSRMFLPRGQFFKSGNIGVAFSLAQAEPALTGGPGLAPPYVCSHRGTF